EGAFMYPPQRLTLDESCERFDAQAELPERKTAFAGQSPLAKSRQILRQVVFRSLDDPQVFSPATLQCRLDQSPLVSCDEVDWLDDHSFPTGLRQPDPPADGRINFIPGLEIDDPERRGGQQL